MNAYCCSALGASGCRSNKIWHARTVTACQEVMMHVQPEAPEPKPSTNVTCIFVPCKDKALLLPCTLKIMLRICTLSKHALEDFRLCRTMLSVPWKSRCTWEAELEVLGTMVTCAFGQICRAASKCTPCFSRSFNRHSNKQALSMCSDTVPMCWWCCKAANAP